MSQAAGDASAAVDVDAGPSEDERIRQDGDQVLVWLPADKSAPGEARRVVRERWAHLPDGIVNDVMLITTELVSNAVRHGQPEIVLRLCIEPFAVDVAVLDHGPDIPPSNATLAPAEALSGRGLAIIDKLANAWGVRPMNDTGGKTVWASVVTG